MITELTIEDPKRTPCNWWPEVEAYKGKSKFEFAPTGLTILWGPNGCGKSTLLKVLARLTHCEQGGVPLVTTTSVREIVDALDREDPRLGVSLKKDGKPVHFFDPSNDVGIVGGQFDWDFGPQGLLTVRQQKLSSGQKVTARINRILESAATLQEPGWKIRRNEVNDVWKRWMDVATPLLEKTIEEEGPPTLLLDEPTRSLGLPRQAETWLMLAKQQRFQIIAATHSIFAMNLPGATYIDVVPGYLAECREALDSLR